MGLLTMALLCVWLEFLLRADKSINTSLKMKKRGAREIL